MLYIADTMCLVSSHPVPFKKMPRGSFWCLLARLGRLPLTLICEGHKGLAVVHTAQGRTDNADHGGGGRAGEIQKNASRTKKKRLTKKKNTRTRACPLCHPHPSAPSSPHPSQVSIHPPTAPGDWRDGSNEVGLILGVHGPRAAAQLHRFRFASSKSW